MKKFYRTNRFWNSARDEIARQACLWSCGSEGRMLFENLCEHPEWRERCEELAPKSRTFGPRDTAHVIVHNYFIGAVS
jgi:hypothetical protein